MPPVDNERKLTAPIPPIWVDPGTIKTNYNNNEANMGIFLTLLGVFHLLVASTFSLGHLCACEAVMGKI